MEKSRLSISNWCTATPLVYHWKLSQNHYRFIEPKRRFKRNLWADFLIFENLNKPKSCNTNRSYFANTFSKQSIKSKKIILFGLNGQRFQQIFSWIIIPSIDLGYCFCQFLDNLISFNEIYAEFKMLAYFLGRISRIRALRTHSCSQPSLLLTFNEMYI